MRLHVYKEANEIWRIATFLESGRFAPVWGLHGDL